MWLACVLVYFELRVLWSQRVVLGLWTVSLLLSTQNLKLSLDAIYRPIANALLATWSSRDLLLAEEQISRNAQTFVVARTMDRVNPIVTPAEGSWRQIWSRFVEGFTIRDPWPLIFPHVPKQEPLAAKLKTRDLDDFQEYCRHSPFASELFCPISQEVMSCPVIASDGSTYDAFSIITWILTKYSLAEIRAQGSHLAMPSPLTNTMISITSFYPNLSVKTLVGKFYDAYRSTKKRLPRI